MSLNEFVLSETHSLKILSLRIIMINMPFYGRNYKEKLRKRISQRKSTNEDMERIEEKILTNVNQEYNKTFQGDPETFLNNAEHSLYLYLQRKQLLLLTEKFILTVIINCKNFEILGIDWNDYNNLSLDVLCSRINEISPNVIEYINNKIHTEDIQVLTQSTLPERPGRDFNVSEITLALELIYTKSYEKVFGEIPCIFAAIFITNTAENIEFLNSFTDILNIRTLVVMITKCVELKRLKAAQTEIANSYRQKASLEKLCLDKITESISANIHNYKQRRNDQDRHIADGIFEGLPDKYLNIIYTEYEKIIGEVPSDEIFLTRHSRSAKLSNIDPRKERLLLTLSTKCQGNLKSLTLVNCEICELVLNNLFMALKNLEKLDLTGTSITDETLGIISTNMKSLSELNLNNTVLTNTGLKHLLEEKLPNLRILKLKDNFYIADTDLLQILSFYPELEVLENELIFKALVFETSFSTRENVTETEIISNTKLTSLEISVNINQKHFSRIFQLFPNLTHLHLIKYPSTDIDLSQGFISCFQNMSITRLTLTGLNVNISDILSNFSRITEFQLINCFVVYEPDDFSEKILKTITSLYIDNCEVTNRRVIEHIFFSLNLKEITIMNFKLANRFIIDMIEGTCMHFNSLSTNCMAIEYLKTIINNNKNLQSILIRKPDDGNIPDNFIVKLNVYFREMISGKRSKSNLLLGNSDQELLLAIQHYTRELDYNPF